MRQNWFTGVEAMMTVLRVLPPDLYDAVMSGDEELPPGISVPGGGPGASPHEHMHHGAEHQPMQPGESDAPKQHRHNGSSSPR
jgi:hypothetical protein